VESHTSSSTRVTCPPAMPSTWWQ